MSYFLTFIFADKVYIVHLKDTTKRTISKNYEKK